MSGLPETAGYDKVAGLSHARWPYGGLVYFQLLLDGLAASGPAGPGSQPERRIPAPLGSRPLAPAREPSRW